MKKFALILSLVSFVCFIGLSTSYAQDQKPAKETKIEKTTTTGTAAATAPATEKTAGCNHAKDAKCAKPCDKKDAKCCPSKTTHKCPSSGDKDLK
jgi:hypothetical protein